MNVQTDRRFDAVVLGADGLAPNPKLMALILMVRANKRVRLLAKSAAAQQRHLCDEAAFESFLSRAAMALIDRQIDPEEWLEQEIRDIQSEQSITRQEHARMSERIVELADFAGDTRTKANFRRGNRASDTASGREGRP